MNTKLKAELLIPCVQYGNIKVFAEGTAEEIISIYFEVREKIEAKLKEDLENNRPF